MHNAGLGDSSGGWLGCTFRFWAAWSCINSHRKWPSTVFDCCCPTGTYYELLLLQISGILTSLYCASPIFFGEGTELKYVKYLDVLYLDF